MATDRGERLARRTPEPRNRPKWVPFFLVGFFTIAPFLGMWDGRRASARTGGERSRSGDLLQLELRRPEWLTETRRKNLIKWGGSACVLVGVLDNPEIYFRWVGNVGKNFGNFCTKLARRIKSSSIVPAGTSDEYTRNHYIDNSWVYVAHPNDPHRIYTVARLLQKCANGLWLVRTLDEDIARNHGEDFEVHPESVKFPNLEMPLMAAVVNNDTEAVNWVLNRYLKGAKFRKDAKKDQAINGCDPHKRTPFYQACKLGNIQMMSLLLNGGADINKAQCNGGSPLYITCQSRNYEAVQLLVTHNADPYIATQQGATPLHITAQYGEIKIGKTLLEARKAWKEKHPDMKEDRRASEAVSPVYLCAQNGFVEFLDLLLEYGEDPNHQIEENRGLTPLMIAVHNDRYQCAKTLLRSGADPSLPSFCNGDTPLLLATEYGKEEMAKLLVEFGAEVNQPNDPKITPLILATLKNYTRLATFFLEAQANPNAETQIKDTALLWAICHRNPITIRKLLEFGATPNVVSDRGASPLLLAVQSNDEQLAELLLQKGADPNLKSTSGISPLALAKQLQLWRLTNLLSEYGAEDEPTATVAKVEEVPEASF